MWQILHCYTINFPQQFKEECGFQHRRQRGDVNSTSDQFKVNLARMCKSHGGYTCRSQWHELLFFGSLLGQDVLSRMLVLLPLIVLLGSWDHSLTASRCGWVRTISLMPCFPVFIKSPLAEKKKKRVGRDQQEDVWAVSFLNSSLVRSKTPAPRLVVRTPLFTDEFEDRWTRLSSLPSSWKLWGLGYCVQRGKR